MMRPTASVTERTTEIETTARGRLQPHLDKAGFHSLPTELMVVAFKEERILQVFGKDDMEMRFIKQFPFTAFSGKLGPKLMEGDRQIPEGIYKIEYLNPNSSFHLSLKVSYPNAFDIGKSKFSDKARMGGDIFIHGKSLTIGCIPIGDAAVEEVFLLAQKAFDKEIRVIIGPWDFRVKSRYPEIEEIDWEDELYGIIEKELASVP